MSKIKETPQTLITRAGPANHPDVHDLLTKIGFSGDVPAMIRYDPITLALVLSVEGGAEFSAHRVPLDGSAGVTLGDSTGGSVRLSNLSGLLFLVREVAAGLALLGGMQKIKKRASVWCTLCADGMAQLNLPRVHGHIVLCCDDVDHDAGEALLASAIDRGWTGEILSLPLGQNWQNFVFGGTK